MQATIITEWMVFINQRVEYKMTNKVFIIITSKYITIQYTSRWYFDLHVQVYKSLHPCQYWECSKKKSGRFEVSGESSAATVDRLDFIGHSLFWVIENIQYWCVTSTVSKLQNWFCEAQARIGKERQRWWKVKGLKA